ncbi:hypothetical protein ACT80S_06835 [Ramlibacter sp. MAHUQ-53]|uniref:hypothetical protein n=1 Tax=unclassified Ramlibacter TaxID=2617605 RepID=UPI0036404222
MHALTLLPSALLGLARSPAQALPDVPTPAAAVAAGVSASGTGAIDPWEIARFTPVEQGGTLAWMGQEFRRAWKAGGTGRVLASQAALGAGLATPAGAATRLHALKARGEALQDTLGRYAQARRRAGASGDAAWVADLAAGRQDLLLATPQEHGLLAGSATSAVRDGKPDGRRIVWVPHHGLLVDAQRTQQSNTGRLTAGAVRDVQALLVHPRCRELLELAARLSGQEADRLERALHGHITGQDLGHLPCDPDTLLTALVQGDRAAVARALVPRQVRATVAASPLMTPCTGEADGAPAHDFLAVVADALAHDPPQRHRTRQLLKLLEERPLRALRQALLHGDPQKLQQVMMLHALLRANDAARAALQPMLGAHDLLEAGQLRVAVFPDPARLAKAVTGPLAARLASGAVPAIASGSHHDDAAWLEGLEAARKEAAAETYEPRSAGRGVQSRALVDAAPNVAPVMLCVALGGKGTPQSPALRFSTLLGELLAAYPGAYACGAAQGTAQALGLPASGLTRGLAVDSLSGYLTHKLTGEPLREGDEDRVASTRRTIESLAEADGVDFTQAERDVLGVLYNARSFGNWKDFANLARITRCLHEQRKVDLLHKGAGGTAGRKTVHALGDSVFAPRGMRVTLVERQRDTFVVRTERPLPRPLPRGVIPKGRREYLVEPHHLISVRMADPAPVEAALRRTTVTPSAGGSPSGSPAGGS